MHADAHLTPDDIVNQQFSTTRFSAGYDQDQVDELLDAIVATMRAHASGGDASGLPRSSDLATVAFAMTRFRDGYATDEVDAFLDRAQLALAALEGGSAAG